MNYIVKKGIRIKVHVLRRDGKLGKTDVFWCKLRKRPSCVLTQTGPELKSSRSLRNFIDATSSLKRERNTQGKYVIDNKCIPPQLLDKIKPVFN